jgi:hypothetical protein
MTRSVKARSRGGRAFQHNGRSGQDGPIALWAELRRATEGLFDALCAQDNAVPARHAAARHRLFLALELQCKLQELAVLPALHEAGVATRPMLRSCEEDIAAQRDLVAMAQEPPPEPMARKLLMAALDNLAELQFEHIHGLLHRARHSGRSDGSALRKDMEALLERWEQEVARTGDIEDEEIDPVGLPPR